MISRVQLIGRMELKPDHAASQSGNGKNKECGEHDGDPGEKVPPPVQFQVRTGGCIDGIHSLTTFPSPIIRMRSAI